VCESLFPGSLLSPPASMPRTRYQGSKRKLADWIAECTAGLRFDTVLDAFSGTAAVSHMFKRQGKAVTCNDILRFNHLVGTAIIENGSRTLDAEEIEGILAPRSGGTYPDFIERTFDGIYFTADENRWLDTTCRNLRDLDDPCKRALAWYAVGQAALAKRPYNLFHRRNLYMRIADVPRSFGNKVTWDTPFADLFRRVAKEANLAVFDNGRPCRALNRDALDVEPGYDLVYIDTPYINANGVGVDYHGFYHFLEGLLDYDGWAERIDWNSKHRRLTPQPGPWTAPSRIGAAFRALFERFASGSLVVSYRSDGIPSPPELERLLREVKRHVTVHRYPGRKKYVLSTNGRATEILLVATDDPQDS